MEWSDLQSVDIVDLSFNELVREPKGCKGLVDRNVQVHLDGNFYGTVRGQNPRFNVGWSEMVGRRPTMEDQLCIAGQIGDPKHNMALFALFDGHCGRQSAAFAADHFKEHLLKNLNLTTLESPLKSLVDALVSLNDALREYADNTDRAIRHSGATAIIVLIIGRQLYVANVGDASAIMYKGGDTNKLTDPRPFGLCSPSLVVRLSEDHKPDGEEERIRKEGGYVIKSRVNGMLGVSRSIGDFSTEMVSSLPSAFHYPLPTHQEAFIIMACDGVWDELSDEEACSVAQFFSLKTNKNPHKISTVIRDYSYFFGSDDNISVMVINAKAQPRKTSI